MTASRKRKADDDNGDEMSVSPQSSPAISTRQLSRPSKKARGSEVSGRPLPLPRLLEALDPSQLRTILQTICDQRPDIAHQVAQNAPRPTVASTLKLLTESLNRLRDAVPYGHSSAEYNYYRVRPQLSSLVDAISDYTRQFLPPVEMQTTMSLEFLDGVTKIIQQLPDWENPTFRQHKESAYDEVNRAWVLVITEGSKRAGGFSILSGHWDQTLAKHNQLSGGRLDAAVHALASHVGWMGGGGGGAGNAAAAQQDGTISNDPNSIRNQLMNGTFGSPVRVGPW